MSCKCYLKYFSFRTGVRLRRETIRGWRSVPSFDTSFESVKSRQWLKRQNRKSFALTLMHRRFVSLKRTRERIRYEIKIRYTPFNQSVGRRAPPLISMESTWSPFSSFHRHLKRMRGASGSAIKRKDGTEMEEATSTTFSKFRRPEDEARMGGIRRKERNARGAGK